MSRRALVVGATGMVGTRLVETLVESDFSVVGLCRTPARPFGRVEYLATDLLDYETSKNDGTRILARIENFLEHHEGFKNLMS